jgi:predicted naringenin-chalcone synthase
MAAAEPAAKVLLCAVELCSLHDRLQWDEERIRGNALFADRAASLVGASATDDRPVASANARVFWIGQKARLPGNSLIADLK